MSLGRYGEIEASRFLQNLGYHILAEDVRVGRGQLDLVARDGAAVCFVEVKTRASRRKGAPAESVTPRKQAQLVRTALRFLQQQRWESCQIRFDVVSVEIDARGAAHCQVIRQAFDPGGHFLY